MLLCAHDVREFLFIPGPRYDLCGPLVHIKCWYSCPYYWWLGSFHIGRGGVRFLLSTLRKRMWLLRWCSTAQITVRVQAYAHACVCVNILPASFRGFAWLCVALSVSEFIPHPEILRVIHICPVLLVQLRSSSFKISTVFNAPLKTHAFGFSSQIELNAKVRLMDCIGFTNLLGLLLIIS